MRWAWQQNWLTSCRNDENQTASHAYIFEEVNQLDRIKRCAEDEPKFMWAGGKEETFSLKAVHVPEVLYYVG
jgi:hypothetical protein